MPWIKRRNHIYSRGPRKDPAVVGNQQSYKMIKFTDYCEYLMESTVELRAFVSADQKERNEYKTFVSTKAHGDYTLGAKLWAAKKNRPANDVFGDLARQQKFMKMTFNFDKFADQDWDDYWMMAQHCDHDRPFQQKALDIIKQYLGDSHSHYKYLSDRISCGLKGTQKYRTQDGCDKDVKSENIGNVRPASMC